MDELGTIGGSDLESTVLLVVGVLFGISQIAVRIAQAIPGKKGDEQMATFERVMRHVVDFLAGRHGKPGDSGAFKPNDEVREGKK